MAKIVDARNMDCPQPVILTINALEESDEVVTIVNDETVRENVVRLGQSRGYEVTEEKKKDGTYIRLVKKKETGPVKQVTAHQETGGIVVFIASDIVGRGENIELGNLLMHSFLNTLSSLTVKPETIIFMNNGVKLVTRESLVVGEIKQLESQGIEIIACGTCLSRLNLMDKVAVGQVSNMYTLAETMLKARKVVSI